MIPCIIALIVSAVLSIFSAKYRKLTLEAFRCVLRKATLRPCETGMDERMRAEAVAHVLRYSPPAARVVNRHFEAVSAVFFILSIASFAYSALSVYNFYYYGNCEGPVATGACFLNTLTGDYGRFSEPKELIAPAELDGLVTGDRGARNTIIEFGCFTCPYTADAEPVVKRLLAENNGSLLYVFKPFPLPNHKSSSAIASAVLCADRQGKAWEFRDSVFSNQKECISGGMQAIETLAAGTGLDMGRFRQCMDNNETGAELDRYIQQGKEARIYATPTFFVNGKPIVGPKPIEEFRREMKSDGWGGG